jgi:4-hydroxy-tetrahydrodipicolinate synthase
MFSGSIVAIVTPFRNGSIDESALQSLVEWHLEQGTDGFVPVGTTGESPTLSHEEHERVVEIVVEAVAGRRPVIAGAGSNSTTEAIRLGRHAKTSGADAILVVTPYYNKPTQGGLYAHFKAIHDAVDLPIVIYNIPPRSVVDMSVETMAALAQLPNIVGVKDATCDLARPLLTTKAWISASCRARTSPRWPSTRTAGSAVSRSPPTSRRASAPRCRMPGGGVRRPRRWRSINA